MPCFRKKPSEKLPRRCSASRPRNERQGRDIIPQAGLASYFYSRDDKAASIPSGQALEYGMVGINVGIIATEGTCLAGGVKQSGHTPGPRR